MKFNLQLLWVKVFYPEMASVDFEIRSQPPSLQNAGRSTIDDSSSLHQSFVLTTYTVQQYANDVEHTPPSLGYTRIDH